MNARAIDHLGAAQRRTGSIVSVGLEPADGYMPACFEPTQDGRLAFLRAIVESARDIAPAFKFNLAFFESLGHDGALLLDRARSEIDDESFVIADVKRGDIASTAEHSARACFGVLGAHAATVNPLMGRDAVEPFGAHADRLTYVLCLTSNPSASDFLDGSGLSELIAEHAERWSDEMSGSIGLVVGATRSERIAAIRAKSPSCPLLVPGVGAQGGDIAATVGALAGSPVPLVHVTRGILPIEAGAIDEAGFRAHVRTQLDHLNAAIANVRSGESGVRVG